MLISKIFSTLGNPQSLVPLAVKDTANSMGMTISSSITNKDEGRDRFIDEFGTEVIWIGGIPTFKKIIDNTLFKAVKYDAKYDVRNLQNEDIFEKTKEYAPTSKIKEGIEKIGKNKKTFKYLNGAKFVLSTLMTLGAYNLLTDAKQKYTHNRIKTKLLKQEENKSKELMQNASKSLSSAAKDSNFSNLSRLRTTNDNSNINFQGGFDIMLDPVKNTLVLDGGITSERLAKSRSPQEFMGYAIKEGGFLFFMYYLGQKVQSHFENVADKKHNKNIGLDVRVLENDELKDAFATKSIESDLAEFKKFTETGSKDVELYEFLHTKPENRIVKFAKEAEIIETYKEPKKWYEFFKKPKDTGKIDTRKYINLGDVRDVHKNMARLYNQFNESGQTVDEFFNGVRKLKRGSIIKNIGSTIIALGVVLPSIMLADRLLKPDNKEFAVEKEIKAQLASEKE